jgi:hypothetical protein
MNKWANEVNQAFAKEGQMAKNTSKKMLSFLAIKEMKIKTTLKFHFAPASIKKTTNNKCW